MPSSRFLISSQTLTSSAASVTFSSIPATYTDLVIRWSIRMDAGFNQVSVHPNNATTNLSITYLEGNGAAASSGSSTADLWVRGANPSTYTASTFSSAEVYIPSYTVSQNKPMFLFGLNENNATTALISATAGLWSSTTAITSLVLANPQGGNFVSGSSFYLYGIKSS